MKQYPIYSGKKHRAQVDMFKVAFAGGLALLVILVAVFLFISSQPDEKPGPLEKKITLVEIATLPQKVTPGQTFTVAWKVMSTSPLKIMNTAAYFWKQPSGNPGLTTAPENTSFESYTPNYLNMESQVPGTFSAELTAPDTPGRIFVRAHAEYLGKNYWSDEQAITVEEEGDGFEESPEWSGGPLNFVVIYTDDQRWDTLWAMPNLQTEIIEKGIEFENAFQTTPVCCPSRASFLGGGFYPFHTQVLFNAGGASAFYDKKTLATMLQENGYRTAMLGKYLNHYKDIQPYVPPGWDLFAGTDKHGDWFNAQFVFGSTSSTRSGTGEVRDVPQYLTDFLSDQAIEFIDGHAQEKFFVYITPTAPHKPATPAPEDESKFSGFAYDSPSLNEDDLSDKPSFVQNPKRPCDEEEREEGECTKGDPELFKNQLRSLQAVDRMVKAIVDKLEQEGLLDNTVIIYSSDNGYMWGEHGQYFKSKPYEESIRVPLAMRFPGIQNKKINKLVAVNLDVPTTILRLAGIRQETDGLDLYGLMAGRNVAWRNEIVFQIYNQDRWRAIRNNDYKYVVYENGEREFYDLQNDPFELESQHKNQGFSALMQEMERKLEPLTGLRINQTEIDPSNGNTLPKFILDEPYSFTLHAYGGNKPYKWGITEFKEKEKNEGIECLGRLPEGLELRSDGTITGIPTKKEECIFTVEVTDSSVSPQSGRPQIDTTNISMRPENR